ncbi:hypothetical protein LB58_18785 [Salmonella enterica]|nr:hypothetical protein [Salmonella enterica]
MKINKKKMLIGFSVITFVSAIAVRATGITDLTFDNGISIDCVSTISMPELPHGTKFNGSVYVQIHTDGSGEVDFSGVITETGELGVGKKNVQRTISFEYEMVNSDTVRLSEARLSKKSTDTIPDDFFTKSIYDSTEPEKRMHVSKLQNAYLIGNVFSPSLLCVSKS